MSTVQDDALVQEAHQLLERIDLLLAPGDCLRAAVVKRVEVLNVRIYEGHPKPDDGVRLNELNRILDEAKAELQARIRRGVSNTP